MSQDVKILRTVDEDKEKRHVHCYILIFLNVLSLVSPRGSVSLRWIHGFRGLPLSAEGGLSLHISRLRDNLETDTEQVWISIIHLNQLCG